MSTLTEAESDETPRLCLAAVEQLPVAEQAKLARWLQDRCDPDHSLELRPSVAQELDAARQEIAQGVVADWEQLKRSVAPASR